MDVETLMQMAVADFDVEVRRHSGALHEIVTNNNTDVKIPVHPSTVFINGSELLVDFRYLQHVCPSVVADPRPGNQPSVRWQTGNPDSSIGQIWSGDPKERYAALKAKKGAKVHFTRDGIRVIPPGGEGYLILPTLIYLIQSASQVTNGIGSSMWRLTANGDPARRRIFVKRIR